MSRFEIFLDALGGMFCLAPQPVCEESKKIDDLLEQMATRTDAEQIAQDFIAVGSYIAAAMNAQHG